MKKLILSFIIVCALGITLGGCKKNHEIQEVHGKVTSVELSLKKPTMMRVSVDTDTLLFKLDDARFTNGVMMYGDSITVYYIKGRGDTLRGLIVNVMPQAPHYFDPSEYGDTLLTAPINNETNTLAE